MHGNGLREAETAGGGFQGLDVLGGGDGRGETPAQQGHLFAPPETCHDEDGQADSGLAHGHAFFGGGDAQPLGTGVFQGARNLDDPMAVGIAFDDTAGSDFGPKMARNDAIVRGQRGEGDLRPVGTRVHGEFLLRGRQVSSAPARQRGPRQA